MKRMMQYRWFAFGVASAIFAFFIAVVLPNEAVNLANATSVPGSPDTSLIYGPGQFYAWAAGYGEAGRAYYIQSRFGFDLVWPLAYGFFLFTGIRAGGFKARQVLALIPVLTVLFDYAENTLAAFLMGLYPTELSPLVYVASFATFVKWVTLGLSFGLLMTGFGLTVKERLQRTRV
jgi:hypothetical protein